MRPATRPSHFRTPRTVEQAFGPRAGIRIPRHEIDPWSAGAIILGFVAVLCGLASVSCFIALQLIAG